MNFSRITKSIRKGLKRSAVPALCAAVLLAYPVVQVSATTSAEVRQQEQQTQQQINEANSAAESAQASQNEVSSNISYTNDQLVQNMASIQMLESEIADLDTQIAEKQQEYDTAKDNEEKQYESMKSRIKYLYEQGEDSYLSILLTATSFSDMLNKAAYVGQLYEYDQNMIDNYKKTQEEVAAAQQDLEDTKSEQESEKVGLEEEQNNLNDQLADLQAQYADYEQKIADAQAQATQLAAKLEEQHQQEAQLEAKEEAERQAALAAAQKAAEEAKKKAQEEAAAAASSAAAKSTTSSSFSSSSSSSQTTSTTTTSSSSSESTTSSSTTSSAPAVSSSGVSGSDVVNYALQFVGNPYVYGGTSLTNGTDCSGFTMSVYAHFGYSLGRTDVAQRSNGISVGSLAEAQPGDLICYAGHVALYIGNGMIVHASNPSSGIKISNANYRAYVCIRRIIY